MRLGDIEMTVTLDGDAPENASIITELGRALVRHAPAMEHNGIRFAVVEGRTTAEILPRRITHTFTLRNILDEENTPDAP